jgi:para-nitrobenzyl esterase
MALPGGEFYQGGAPAWVFNAVVDGDVLPDQPRALYDSGRIAKVPYILGSNSDEGTLFHFGSTPVDDEAGMRAALGRVWPASTVDQILALYPVASFASANAALERVTGDAVIVCPTRDAARRAASRVGHTMNAVIVCPTRDAARRAAAAGAPVRMYNFAFPLPIKSLTFLGATHGAEIAFVFDSVNDPSQATVGAAVRGYWTRFAATGDPNGDGALAWPAFSASSDTRLNFDTQPTVVSDFRKDVCDFWATLYDAEFTP